MSDPRDEAPSLHETRPGRPPAPKAGEICPNCGFAALRTEAKGHVRCPVCGFSTAPPCT